MVVVGYSDDIWVDINSNGIVDAGEKGAFRIANSWGAGWQEGGFSWFAYDALKQVSAVPGAPSAGRQEGWWYGEACWVTARSSYTPQMVGEFTLNHLERNHLAMTLGIDDRNAKTPSTAWSPERCLWNAGGPFAFDGSTTACDGTFYFDFTDLVANKATTTKLWFVGMNDNTAGDIATIRSFNLYEVGDTGDVLVGSAANAPETADDDQVYVWVGYTYDSDNLLPVAVAAGDPTTGYEPLIVDFDGSSSYDSDGAVISYTWDFGDDSTASSATPTVSTIYTTPGAFPVTLTVRDDRGATATASLTITVLDPDALNPPTDLAIETSAQDAILTWTDNSMVESGFYIEWLVKIKGKTSFVRIATVGPNVTIYTDASLAAGTYTYRVQAFRSDPAETSDYCEPVEVSITD
ncbi:PKD domain-containing protein, partial [bacterium]|nr:PKD domain-containing protein [bacterium]